MERRGIPTGRCSDSNPANEAVRANDRNWCISGRFDPFTELLGDDRSWRIGEAQQSCSSGPRRRAGRLSMLRAPQFL